MFATLFVWFRSVRISWSQWLKAVWTLIKFYKLFLILSLCDSFCAQWKGTQSPLLGTLRHSQTHWGRQFQTQQKETGSGRHSESEIWTPNLSSFSTQEKVLWGSSDIFKTIYRTFLLKADPTSSQYSWIPVYAVVNLRY